MIQDVKKSLIIRAKNVGIPLKDVLDELEAEAKRSNSRVYVSCDEHGTFLYAVYAPKKQ